MRTVTNFYYIQTLVSNDNSSSLHLLVVNAFVVNIRRQGFLVPRNRGLKVHVSEIGIPNV